MAYVVEINRVEDLEPLRLVWHALWTKTRRATFFQTLDWLQTYWRHFGRNQKLRALVVHSGGEPIGILPLTVITESTRIGRVRVLTYPLHDWGTFYGPIGPNLTATLTVAMQHLHRTPRDWDLLDLRWVNKHELDRGRTPQAMQSAGFQGRESIWTETALVEFGGTFDDYLNSRTTRFRSNVRRYERRVAKMGDVAYERYRPLGAAQGDDDPRWDLFDECVELAERSWQGSSPDGTTLSSPPVHQFLRDAHRMAAKTGTLDLNLLRIDGHPAAFGYNYHWQGQVYGLRAGYAPEFAKGGVGSVLYLNTFRDSIERGDHSIDLGVGSIGVKQNWLTRVARSFRYTHYPLGAPRAQLLRLKHWLSNPRGVAEDVPQHAG
jgi:CelD/BcsL family acetyltransferase involved in cellulose biosynthesis